MCGTGTVVKNVIGYDSGQTRVNNLKMALQIVGYQFSGEVIVKPATAATNSPGGSPRLGPGTPTHGNSEYSECVLLEKPY